MKAKDCTTPEDMLAFAKEVGYKLTGEDLDAINGRMGATWAWGTDLYSSGADARDKEAEKNL